MTREQEIRHECLLQLYGAQGIVLSSEHIRKVARRQAFDYSDGEIRAALYFLVGQGFAEKVTDPGTGLVAYRITSKGMLQYENEDASH